MLMSRNLSSWKFLLLWSQDMLYMIAGFRNLILWAPRKMHALNAWHPIFLTHDKPNQCDGQGFPSMSRLLDSPIWRHPHLKLQLMGLRCARELHVLDPSPANPIRDAPCMRSAPAYRSEGTSRVFISCDYDEPWSSEMPFTSAVVRKQRQPAIALCPICWDLCVESCSLSGIRVTV